LLAVAPILPSSDFEATTAFYEPLGFERVGLWPGEYLILGCGEVGLHFFHAPDVDPWATDAGCYLYTEDADALHAALARVGLPAAGIPRLQGPPTATDYGLREFAVVDPDGTLLRIGSRVAEPG
jgi:catechol 2,3-dioxygenase-like lactoylglutathione lyase family enzyme